MRLTDLKPVNIKLLPSHAATIFMKYPKTCCLAVLLGLLASSTIFLSRVWCFHYVRVPQPLFHAESPVTDISDGSLEVLYALRQKSTLCFVMYYAHWCARSWRLVYEFHRASRRFQGQVSFIAINCWTGSCGQTYHFHSYPQLYFHHTLYNPLEYKRRHKTFDLITFILNVLYPLTYISNTDSLETFLDQGKPSLLAFFNGTNYVDKKYNHFFGAALLSIDKASSLQFGVITSFQVATMIGLKKFGQVVLMNALREPQNYPPSLNFSDTHILHWAEQNKAEYARELEPELTSAKEFGKMLKSNPALILFVPKNDKELNKDLLQLYHQVATSYHNCSCKTSGPPQNITKDVPIATLDSTREKAREKVCGERLENAHVTSCQSLPLRFGDRYGNQNVCDVCRDCYEACSCDVDSFPLRKTSSTSWILRNMSPLRNSCRSLRRDYQGGDTLSVCCFESTTPRLRPQTTYPRPSGSVGKEIQTDFQTNGHLKDLADKLEVLNRDIKEAVSKNDAGILERLLENLMTMFSSGDAKDIKELDNSSAVVDDIASSENISGNSEYHAFGTCDSPGKIWVFAGGSCYCNITLNFYFMDSRKYWHYALALGVEHDLLSRVALVIVDVKNEAQYVLSEAKPLTNASIVDFVMKFIHGNLTRRLRSAPVPKQSCLHSGCIAEVVSLTFTQLVLDLDKDVFLMYYTPWCGFCKSAKPVFLALADHYKHSSHIRIARIDADVNDLPWQYTVDSYPNFVFFPAKRKDHSTSFPDDEERTLENFIRFVEKHRTSRALYSNGYTTQHGHAELLRLRGQIYSLRRQNSDLKLRLKLQTEARLEAEKKRRAAERQMSTLLDDKNVAERLRLNLEQDVEKITTENARLFNENLDAKEKLDVQNRLRDLSEKRTVELRERNSELKQIIDSLEKSKTSTNSEQPDQMNERL